MMKQILRAVVISAAALLGVINVMAQDVATGLETVITLNGLSAEVKGSGAEADGSVIKISSAGVYRVSGTLDDGQLLIETEDSGLVTLILDGAEIHNATSAPIYIAKAEDVNLVLADGTLNRVSDAGTYVYASPDVTEPDAAVFSNADLTISGTGSLKVEAVYNDGISSDDSLTINDAAIEVTAADDGIRGKDALTITSGTLDITSGGDGLKATNDEDTTLGYIQIDGGALNIEAGGDAVVAETVLTINGGTFDLKSGGGSIAVIGADLSAKGLKAGTNAIIHGGTFVIDAADDAIHADQGVVINGGTFTISTGDDGIHADATIDMNGGVIDIVRSYEGIESAVINITAGDIHVVSSDDGINVAGGDGSGFGGRGQQDEFASSSGYFLRITGGSITVDAQGDGLDSNGNAEMTGGTVIVYGPTESMNGALDYDGSFAIAGGVLVAAGSAGMPQSPDQSSSQPSLLLVLDAVQQGGTPVQIQAADGTEILSFTPVKSYQSIAFSSPELTAGETYNVSIGGSPYTSFTVSGVVTQIGNVMGRGRR